MNTFCRGCGITVKGKLRLSTVALHLCDVGADRTSRSFAPDAGQQHAGTPLPMEVESPYG